MNSHPDTSMLTVRDLCVHYDTSQVLFSMGFELKKGETLALLGRNGAGKSTTMKALAGVIASKTGSIQHSTGELLGLPAHTIARRGLGYVPEDRQIFPDLSVEDNLVIASKAGPEGQHNWDLARVYDMLPLLPPLRDRMGGQLSGGEQQMLTLGRCLMGNPSLILLDEPSEGLAPIMVQRIGEVIQSLRSTGVTILLAEQNLHFCLGLADRAVVIDLGTSVFEGSIETLNANDQLKQKYLSV